MTDGHVIAEGLRLAREPYATARPEAFLLDGVARVADGRPLYGDLETLPFIVHVYNPATYLIVGTLSRVFRLDMPGMLELGRGISLACTALLAVLMAWIVRRETGSPPAALLAAAALIYFSSPLLDGFFRLRPELPAKLATVGAMAAVLSAHRHRAYAAALLFFTAFAFKQPYISAPIGTFLYLLATGARRDAWRLAGTLGSLLLVFFAAMAVWSGGHYYECAVLSMAWNDVEPWDALRANVLPLADRIGGLLAAAPVAIVILARSPRHRVLIAWLAVSLVTTWYTAGKYGAHLNYYAELGVVLLLLAAIACGLARGAWRWCVLLPLVAHVAYEWLEDRPWKRRFDGTEVVNLDAYVEGFRDLEGKLLVTNERLAVRLGDPEVLDWVLMKHLAERGHFDKSQLFGRIGAGYYDYVVVDPQVSSRVEGEVFEAVRRGPYERTLRDRDWNKMQTFRRRPSHPGP
ncbi:MAG TPA: hypothetical protein VKU85_11155 [bacterium]|nr:hypothetical protein [bacterium]